MTWLWVALYVLAALVSVPFMARAFYMPGEAMLDSKAGCIGWALVCCYAWPLFLLFLLGWWVSHKLVPVIFR